jgi:hypothetical protein
MFAALVSLCVFAAFSTSAVVPAVDQFLGNIAPGQSVRICYEVTINDPLPTNVTQISHQGIVSGLNFSTAITDDPETGAANDPTVTDVTVPAMITFCPPSVVTNTTGLCGQTVAFSAIATGQPRQ